jgi:hypothetical protein
MVVVVVVDLGPTLRKFLMKAAQVAEAVVDGPVQELLQALQTPAAAAVVDITELGLAPRAGPE